MHEIGAHESNELEEAVRFFGDLLQREQQKIGDQRHGDLDAHGRFLHLAVISAECGVSPAEVMAEIDRRERVCGIAEKLPKQGSAAQIRRMAPWAAARRKAS
jgi:hypothetical protein